MTERGAVVVGAGPNGLAAAVTLARAGVKVTVLERMDGLGGGARTAEVTLPGFRHDLCSAVHPMAYLSTFFTRFGLRERVDFVDPEIPYAHGVAPGRVAVAHRDLDRTAAGLGSDADAFRSLLRPFVDQPELVARLVADTPLKPPIAPLGLLRIGLSVLEQGSPLWDRRWRTEEAPALLTGAMAHPIQPMPGLGWAAAGMMLAASAHIGGWPIPVGGSQAMADAMVDDARAHGAEFVTGTEVTGLDDLGDAAVILDVSPRALADIAGDRLPDRYVRALRRYRYGGAAAKVDLALSGPVPWTDPRLREAGTVHLGGTRAQMAEAEAAIARGEHPSTPYVLVSQPSVFDPTRAPAGSHVLWAYTHVPAYSTLDPTEAILQRLEQFAPGLRDLVLHSTARSASDLAAYNPNYVGGDIAVGDVGIRQLAGRPVLSTDPWRTPGRGIYLCSSATPPGPGVHGIPGWRAALSALRHEFGIDEEPDLSPRGTARP
ncbi:NAD(P)/FAD-dependent oxidoreductase [Ornithinimicrobium humiphilum]|uniref:Phytoene dehydrogenase-like protein n=1 Tax=Ornithinimicrobium humiphilum TaxID=125288 RepID=A0A543K835_9MICO|nr:NAD(P)/FAD-dependent oxidoreductase [Ornithinimicrobium humiphilum]TQM91227.1 phytoene dehydrogenase-like protein [Ornithinimicrobium humiphilum]